MATELHFDDKSQTMRTRAFGTVSLEDLTSHPDNQIAAAPDNVGILYEILDAREVENINASILTLVPNVPKMLNKLLHFKGVRLAILSDEDWIIGHANQLASVFHNTSVVVSVFRREEDAVRWLDLQREKDKL